MKSKLIAVIAGVAAVTAGLIGGVAVQADASPATAAQAAAPRVTLTATATSRLSATEAKDLAFMREEEKVARDVYLTLSKKYSVSAFASIAKSESTHMSALKTLLDRYKVADPVGRNPVGVFKNKDLQALYDQLVAQGSKSVTDALKVGVLIEKTDIADLQLRRARTTHSDVKTVYTSLMNGSYNHLSSFESLLARYGG
jgi:hypothetical protein